MVGCGDEPTGPHHRSYLHGAVMLGHRDGAGHPLATMPRTIRPCPVALLRAALPRTGCLPTSSHRRSAPAPDHVESKADCNWDAQPPWIYAMGDD
jgi:hypothetical protein